jgi:putative peptide zinc metalloprotease protein
MSAAASSTPTAPSQVPVPAPRATRPRLLEGTELLGPVQGSALREPPYLVRRPDGEIVQLSRLLYVIARHLDGRDLELVAATAGQELDLRITPDHVQYVADEKLFPVGLIAHSDGTAPALERVDALLALRHRVGIVSERAVNAVARLLSPLFHPAVVVLALAALLTFDVWLLAAHGVGRSVGAIIDQPALGLAFFGLVVLSLAFHECGHAAACRYGGARPGRIGIGLYLIWPVFYTDVTDSYRLGRGGRLRTDLGGVYFNVLFGLAFAGAYLATGFEPLILVVVGQQMLLIDQFVPWVRLDGYHIVSDLIGVSDLFARIKPVLLALVPGHARDPRVTQLKPWARVAVTAWVFSTVLALGTAVVVIVLHAPAYVSRAWQSLVLQVEAVARGGGVVEVTAGVIGTFMLLMPVAGLLLTYLLLCRRLGVWLGLRRAGARLVAGGKAPQPIPTNLPARAPAARAHHDHQQDPVSPPEGDRAHAPATDTVTTPHQPRSTSTCAT